MAIKSYLGRNVYNIEEFWENLELIFSRYLHNREILENHCREIVGQTSEKKNSIFVNNFFGNTVFICGGIVGRLSVNFLGGISKGIPGISIRIFGGISEEIFKATSGKVLR